MLKKIPVAKNISLKASCLLTSLIVFYALIAGCNPEIKPDCKHQFLAPNEAAALVDIGEGVSPYFLRLDTSKHIKSHQLYNQISELIEQCGINPRESAIQWGQTQKNEIVIFAGTDDHSAINKFFRSLVENKKNYFGEVQNLDSCKIIFLFSKLSWEKDKDGYELPYIKGELKGLKEL